MRGISTRGKNTYSVMNHCGFSGVTIVKEGFKLHIPPHQIKKDGGFKKTVAKMLLSFDLDGLMSRGISIQ
ncbi:hypothetical protein SAMN05446037_1006119 [Anaerovirgula multivorans]|uniref:Uncharacterized protein n=1 Tax=Anaerovirgula multivorans TaxID=312168 RepID=A0A239CRE6_9FIRM|nr:hypothetical protein [Anaerovirgula multivorans]SNS22836.1 hypothetical protein SAMN05446037_1006119 [Anaerovirgula multivorans]